jgi:hypothetical protein
MKIYTSGEAKEYFVEFSSSIGVTPNTRLFLIKIQYIIG